MYIVFLFAVSLDPDMYLQTPRMPEPMPDIPYEFFYMELLYSRREQEIKGTWSVLYIICNVQEKLVINKVLGYNKIVA
jgi:hypothetical protein